MKTKHSLFLALLLIVTLPTFSQEDTRSEILNLPESDFNFVNKARRLLGTYIKDGNIVEATKVKDALLDEYHGELSEAFYNVEYIHLLYALGEYDTLANFMEIINFEQLVSSNVKTSSQTDNLRDILFENTIAYNDVIAIDIRENVEDDMVRDFILLVLNDISDTSRRGTPEWQAKMDNTNKLASEYLAQHPDSPYDEFVRKHIRFEFKDADWGFYWDFGLGGTINGSELRNSIGGGGFAATMGFEYRYRTVLGQFNIEIADSKLAKDININNTTWNKNSSSTNVSFALSAGYLLLENKRWSIYPLAGAGYASIYADGEQTKENPNLKKLKINTFYPEVGFGIDFKSYYTEPFTMERSPFGRVSLKYKYKMYSFDRKDPIFKGHQHFITLSYGLGGRPQKRVK